MPSGSASPRRKPSARATISSRGAIDPDKIIGLDTIVKDAVALKFTADAAHQGAARRADPDSAAVVGRGM